MPPFSLSARVQESSCFDLKNIVVVVDDGVSAAAEFMAATVLIEEVEKRTGLHWEITAEQPKGRATIALQLLEGSGAKPESYRLRVVCSF